MSFVIFVISFRDKSQTLLWFCFLSVIIVDNFVIYSTFSGVNCGQFWYFGTLSEFQVIIAENYCIFKTLSCVYCGQFWYFGTIPLEKEITNWLLLLMLKSIFLLYIRQYCRLTTIIYSRHKSYDDQQPSFSAIKH